MARERFFLELDPPDSSLKSLPHVVVVIDELADLMMVVGKKIEELIARLAQKARASSTSLSRGISTSTLLRLCSFAPTTVSFLPFPLRRELGTAIFDLPAR